MQVTDTDRYGRSVARLFVAGQDAGLFASLPSAAGVGMIMITMGDKGTTWRDREIGTKRRSLHFFDPC